MILLLMQIECKKKQQQKLAVNLENANAQHTL